MWCDEFFNEYEQVIAVNTSGWRYIHHWLCGFDPHIFLPVFERRDGYKLPLIGVKASAPYATKATALGWRGELFPMQARVNCTPEQQARAGTERCIYTFPNTLHFAMTRWSGPVHIYGMDYALGLKDFVGVKGDRGLKRFRHEAAWVREFWNESRITIFGKAADNKPLLEYLAGRADKWL